MNSLATVWTDLERTVSADPADWPALLCPAGHRVILTPSSHLWNKETGRLTRSPHCFECENEKAAERSRRRSFHSRETALRAHGVPASFARQPFLGSLPRILGHDLASWAGGPDAWAVVLHGVGGAGKSMLAAELLWQRLPYVHTAVWWRAAQLVDALFGSLGEEAKIRAHQDCNTELLVLDDLGHIVGDRGFDSLYNVIAARQEDDRATIVTLNEPLLAFCKRQWAIGSKLSRGTIPVPFTQTYAQRAGQEP